MITLQWQQDDYGVWHLVAVAGTTTQIARALCGWDGQLGEPRRYTHPQEPDDEHPQPPEHDRCPGCTKVKGIADAAYEGASALRRWWGNRKR